MGGRHNLYPHLARPKQRRIQILLSVKERLAGLETIDLTHHSDRGVQYASEAYVELLNELGVKISMTESGDPRDNPVAERLNGTVKNEFMKDIVFHSAAQVRSVMPRIVEFYNTQRPHMSLDGMMPSEAAKMTGRIRDRKDTEEMGQLQGKIPRQPGNKGRSLCPCSTNPEFD